MSPLWRAGAIDSEMTSRMGEGESVRRQMDLKDMKVVAMRERMGRAFVKRRRMLKMEVFVELDRERGMIGEKLSPFVLMDSFFTRNVLYNSIALNFRLVGYQGSCF